MFRRLQQPTPMARRAFHSASRGAAQPTSTIAPAARTGDAMPSAASTAGTLRSACFTLASLRSPPRRSFTSPAFRASPATATATPTAAVIPAAPSSSATGGWFGRLPDQSVIRITSSSPTAPAAELLKYLHNLTTQDMYAAASPSSTSSSSTSDISSGCGYTMFLNSKGRVLFDAVFAPIDAESAQWLQQSVTYTPDTSKGPAGVARAGMFAGPIAKPPPATASTSPRGFYFTVHTAALPLALAHLHQFNLRRKVVITDLTDQVDVWQTIPFRVLEDVRQGRTSDDSRRPQELLGGATTEPMMIGLSATIDPRTPTMGVRIITSKGAVPNLPSSSSSSSSSSGGFTQVADPSFFDTYRILVGISSAPLDLLAEKSLPLEHSLGAAGGVSFWKGCYLGQELTARTHHQGVVRKKVWPIYAPQQPCATTTEEEEGGHQQASKSTMTGGIPKLQELMAAPRDSSAPPSPSASSSSCEAGHAPHWRQLESYFPFFRYSPTPVLPSGTPITREVIDAATAGAAVGPGGPPPASGKEVARVLSSSSNVALAMLRTEHIEDATTELRAQLEGASVRVQPYEPNWWMKRPEA